MNLHVYLIAIDSEVTEWISTKFDMHIAYNQVGIIDYSKLN